MVEFICLPFWPTIAVIKSIATVEVNTFGGGGKSKVSVHPIKPLLHWDIHI